MSVVKFTASLFAAVVCLALAAAQAGALTFTPAAHYRVGSHPADLASGDLNGDGLPDIAVAVAGSESVGILLAAGNGRFAPAVRVPAGHAPRSIALGDLNGDGALDVVTAAYGDADGSVSVLLGRGDGSLVLTGTYPTADRGLDVAVGDLSGDDVSDVVTGGDLGPALLAGDGAGGLLPPLRLPADGQCSSVALEDFDLDGHLDLAATRHEWDEYEGFAVLLSDGAGGFSPQTVHQAWLEPNSIAAGDLNADRLPDLVSLENLEGTGVVQGFLGDGLGTLIQASRSRVDPRLHRSFSYAGLAVGDLSGDGYEDVVTTGIEDSRPPGPPLIYILCGHGPEGSYFTRVTLPAERRAIAVVLDDFNGDGKSDFATADDRAGSVSVRIKGTLPRLTALSPSRGRVGDMVTLRGRLFRKYRGTGEVRFGGVPVTKYLSWSNTVIKVRVPAGTRKGAVNVTVTSIIGRSGAKTFLRL
jgi:hypothetical protein